MKVVILLEVHCKKDSFQVYKAVNISHISPVMYIPSGPNKRLNNDIDISINNGLRFRVDNKNIVCNAEKDEYLVVAFDETERHRNLKEVLKEYTDCGWEVFNS